MVVTHQWSGDPSIKELFPDNVEQCRNSPMIWWPFNLPLHSLTMVTRRNSPMIWWPFNDMKQVPIELVFCRNSPMIWWPFNLAFALQPVLNRWVVTHQWSGDPSMIWNKFQLNLCSVVTHQWSGDPSMIQKNKITIHWQGRNSPMIWWPFNGIADVAETLNES